MKLILLLFLLLLTPVVLQAATISGFITDLSDGESLAAANVTIEDTNFGTITNADGYYALIGVPSGKHVLIVTYIGYKAYRVTFSIESDSNIRQDISLVAVALTGEEATVEADRYREERLAQPSFLSLRAKETE